MHSLLQVIVQDLGVVGDQTGYLKIAKNASVTKSPCKYYSMDSERTKLVNLLEYDL